MPGKNSEFFANAGARLFMSGTSRSPMWFRAIVSMVSGRSTCASPTRPPFTIMRVNAR